MAYETIVFEREAALATITLHRPERMNAIDRTLASECRDAVRVCAADPGVRAVLLTGAGRGFCSGGDQKRTPSSLEDPEGGLDLINVLHDLIRALRELPKPVVAAVNGAAAGAGMNLALACDFRIAADTARFSQAFVRIGLSPDSGGTYWLPRLVGLAKAIELLLTGATIDAREAERLGLVNRVVPAADLPGAARELALRLAGGPTLAIGRAKVLLNQSFQNDLAAQLERERDMIGLSYRTADFREGTTAFVEKRTPRFQGR